MQNVTKHSNVFQKKYIQGGPLIDHALKSDLFGDKLSVLSSQRGKHGNMTPHIHYSMQINTKYIIYDIYMYMCYSFHGCRSRNTLHDMSISPNPSSFFPVSDLRCDSQIGTSFWDHCEDRAVFFSRNLHELS